jgi:hypothetical protein
MRKRIKAALYVATKRIVAGLIKGAGFNVSDNLRLTYSDCRETP